MFYKNPRIFFIGNCHQHIVCPVEHVTVKSYSTSHRSLVDKLRRNFKHIFAFEYLQMIFNYWLQYMLRYIGNKLI